jgi:hypothetical protein
MKRYKLTIKHDTGKVNIFTRANDEQQAIEKVCNSEGCPKTAIIKVTQLFWYVAMTDKFMSGWGMADGLTNKFIIECETFEDAQTIKRNASKRSEMKYINISMDAPKYSGKKYLCSHKKFNELGIIWTS